LEYAFAIQELESVRSLPADRVQDLVRRGRGAFLSVQRLRLRPYSNVVETLQWLLEQDYAVVAVTNSPLFRAQQRLFDLKLDGYLAGLVAWEGFEPGDDVNNEGFVPRSRTRRKTRLKRVVGVPLEDCKPNDKHYRIALDAFAGSAWEAWAIGDSLLKDLEPAARLGVKTIWARYGANFDPDDRDDATLLRITHWSPENIAHSYATKGFKPDVTVNSFDEIRQFIPSMVLTLF
jgi:FMN phosphatase YigB (HAD superfamily)